MILEMVDVILIEMTEVKDQIKDLMTVVIVIEEDIVIEDQDLVSGIMTEDLFLSIIIVLKKWAYLAKLDPLTNHKWVEFVIYQSY